MESALTYGGTGTILGRSAAIQRTLHRIDTIARARRTTLITGPTGSGKEVVARALHDRGQRPGAPYVVIHCGALPEQLVESELFGHTRGAFTGALTARNGLVRSAEGGTLFLDEVDSLPPAAQIKLLRFLESGEYRSVGSDQVEQARTWVIAATNRDLPTSVDRGEFRADLLFRLEILRIDLPPLRLREGDIELLAEHFLQQLAPGRRLSRGALAALRAHPWPGNVRELKHCIERAAVLTDSVELDTDDLGLAATDAPSTDVDPESLEGALWDLVASRGYSLAQAVEYCERVLVEAALRAENANRSRAADRLGIHVRTIFKKLSR